MYCAKSEEMFFLRYSRSIGLYPIMAFAASHPPTMDPEKESPTVKSEPPTYKPGYGVSARTPLAA